MLWHVMGANPQAPGILQSHWRGAIICPMPPKIAIGDGVLWISLCKRRRSLETAKVKGLIYREGAPNFYFGYTLIFDVFNFGVLNQLVFTCNDYYRFNFSASANFLQLPKIISCHASHHYFTMSGLPVISAGCGKPMIWRMVGATSARRPSRIFAFLSAVTYTQGTSLSE